MNLRFLKTVRMEEVKDPTGGGEGAAGGGGDNDKDESKDGNGDGDGDGDGESGDSKKSQEKGSDGKNGRSDEEMALLKEVMKKKDRIAELTEAQTKLQAELEKFKDVDIEQVRELLAQREKDEVAKLEKKEQWDRLRERMATEHQKEIDEIKGQLEGVNKSILEKDATIIELTIGHSFDNSKFIPGDTTLTPKKARIIYGDHYDIEDGKVVAYDKPKGSSGRTQLVDGSGNGLSFDESMRRIINDDPEKDSILRSKMKPGANSSSKPADKGPADTVKRTGLDRINAGLKKRTGN